jgi:hypothetical protein
LVFIADYSERALPRLVLDKPPFLDFALIDGGHGWPTVFVDFCYTFFALKRGGVLAIDDTNLYSVNQLVLLLKNQPDFELIGNYQKLAVFRKKLDKRFLPDFGAQPFIKANTVAL